MNKITIALLFFTFILTVKFSYSQAVYPIYIKEYDLYVYPDKGCKVLYEFQRNDSILIKIELKSCKGELNLKLFNNGILIEEGNYVNSLALLSNYKIGRISSRKKMHDEIIVEKFYQPLRHGIWRFYREITKQEIYEFGILLPS